jgi:phosphatidylinositol glycan class C protein
MLYWPIIAQESTVAKFAKGNLFVTSILARYIHNHFRLTSVLSMNAAISSSVVLASRLSDDLAVFALILFAVQAFALFPMLRQRLQVTFASICSKNYSNALIQATSSMLQAFITLLLSTLCIYLTAPLSTTILYLYAATLIFVTFVAPGVLVWAQKYKKYAVTRILYKGEQANIPNSEIRGSWDVAVPKVN